MKFTLNYEYNNQLVARGIHSRTHSQRANALAGIEQVRDNGDAVYSAQILFGTLFHLSLAPSIAFQASTDAEINNTHQNSQTKWKKICIMRQSQIISL